MEKNWKTEYFFSHMKQRNFDIVVKTAVSCPDIQMKLLREEIGKKICLCF